MRRRYQSFLSSQVNASYAWFVGFAVAFAVYGILMKKKGFTWD